MDPKDIHVLFSPVYDNVTLHGKRDFADVIKLRTLGWGDDLDCLSGSNIITPVLIRGMWED